MGKRNNIIPNGHFHKKWQKNVKLWFNQPFKKIKRQRQRQRKAISIAPRPVKGPLRPVVQCPSVRYHIKSRLGRGFSLQELKAAKINKNFAKTIGISVDPRRRNKSHESIQKNKQRLEEYKVKLVLFPKKYKKLQNYESSKEECKNVQQLKTVIMPIKKQKLRLKSVAPEIFKGIHAYQMVKDARNKVKLLKARKKKQKCSDIEA